MKRVRIKIGNAISGGSGIATTLLFASVISAVLVTPLLFPYRPYLRTGGDRESQLPWVLRALDSKFAAGDLELNRGASIRSGFTELVAVFARVLGLDLAWFVLTFLVFIVTLVGLALIGRHSLETLTQRLVFFGLTTLATIGILGYPLSVFSSYFFDLLPRYVVVPLILFSAVILLRGPNSWVAATLGAFLLFLAAGVQWPIAFTSGLALLVAWAVQKDHQGSDGMTVASVVRLPSSTESGTPFQALGLGIIVLSLETAIVTTKSLGMPLPSWLAAGIALYLAAIFALIASDSLLLGLTRLKLFARRLLPAGLFAAAAPLQVLVSGGETGQIRDGLQGFLGSLEVFDEILLLRSIQVSLVDAPAQTLGFLVLLTYLLFLIDRLADKNARPAAEAFWSGFLAIYFLLCWLSEVLYLLPGVGGFVPWPLSSAPIVAVAIMVLWASRISNSGLSVPIFGLAIFAMPLLRSADEGTSATITQVLMLTALLISLAGRWRARRVEHYL